MAAAGDAAMDEKLHNDLLRVVAAVVEILGDTAHPVGIAANALVEIGAIGALMTGDAGGGGGFSVIARGLDQWRSDGQGGQGRHEAHLAQALGGLAALSRVGRDMELGKAGWGGAGLVEEADDGAFRGAEFRWSAEDGKSREDEDGQAHLLPVTRASDAGLLSRVSP